MQTGENSSHSFTLIGRSHGEISGVNEVDCFNEQVIVLSTSMGTMTISGSSLNISHLNQQEGKLVIDGEFDAVEYSGRKDGKEGFLARLLR